jgi:hypothetical protein
MTEADKHTMALEDKQPVSWDQFRDMTVDRGEMEFGAIEQKR